MNNDLMRSVLFSLVLFSAFYGNVSAGELAGQLAWSKRLVLSTTVTGVVDKVMVSPGQKLKKGDVLLSLDAREFKAVLDDALAGQLAAKTTYAEAKREMARSQDLFERTMLSDHDLQVVKNSQAQAKAAYLKARAKLQLAEIALERSRIQAPYNCVVLNVLALPGQTVLSNLRPEPLAVVAEAGRMIARAWLPAAELDKFSTIRAQQVSVAKQKFAVISQNIMPEANDKGLYALDVLFASDGSKLRASQAASIIFP